MAGEDGEGVNVCFRWRRLANFKHELNPTLLAAWVVLALHNSSVNLSVAEEIGRISYAKGLIRALGAGGDCRNADGLCFGDRLIP